MKKLISYPLFFIALFAMSSGVSDQNHSYETPDKRISFGVKIGILPTGKLTEYAVFFYRENRYIGKHSITKEELVKIGTGKWPIPNTNKFHDFFEEYGFYSDTLENGEILDYGAAFDSLWKIRFAVHPFSQGLGNGWSQGDYRPTKKQQAYIQDRYGVRGYDQDYFSDTSFFKLLKDVMDPEWVKHYKSLK